MEFTEIDLKLKEIMQKQCWRSKISDLKFRLRKLSTKPGFSAREIRILKRVVKHQLRNNKIDWDNISFYFPGKSIEEIMNAYNKEIINSENEDKESKSESK